MKNPNAESLSWLSDAGDWPTHRRDHGDHATGQGRVPSCHSLLHQFPREVKVRGEGQLRISSESAMTYTPSTSPSNSAGRSVQLTVVGEAFIG